MQYFLQKDYANSVRLCKLINQAYRGSSGDQRWTSENHLIEGDRITLDDLHADIDSDSVDVIAGVEEGEILCCIAIKYGKEETEFGSFAVAPSLHGKGIGKQTFAYAENQARDRSKRFRVDVVSDNLALVDFYIKRGYVDTGERIPFPTNLDVGQPKKSDLTLTVLIKDL